MAYVKRKKATRRPMPVIGSLFSRGAAKQPIPSRAQAIFDDQ